MSEDDTLAAAMIRLRGAGYTADLVATEDGQLSCGSCGAVEDPAAMRVDTTLRFEGSSDPGDEAILLAVSCECGRMALYSAAYGPAASSADGAVLRRFATRQHT
ncbi:MAG: hypothetical protein R2698_09405 [Microthrixaceae bacterium]